MKPTFKQVPIANIKVGKRFREQYEGIEDLALDLERNGLYNPITLDADLNLLAGGRRLRAMQHLKWEKAPAHILEVSGEIQAREIELLENVMRQNLTWQEQNALTEEIHNLYAQKDPSWSQTKTANLLGVTQERVSQQLQMARVAKEVPEIANSKTEDEAKKKLNMLIETLAVQELARRTAQPESKNYKHAHAADESYRIMDVFEGLATIADNTIHFIECDGPYGIELGEQKRIELVETKWNQYVEVPQNAYPAFVQRLAAETFRVSTRHCWMLFWFGIQWYDVVYKALEGAGWEVDSMPALWIKPNGQTQMPQTKLARGYETFFVCCKDQGFLKKPGRINHFTFTPVASQEKYHPTQKPRELIEELLRTFVWPAPPVGPDYPLLVPFAGSGVTLLTAAKLGYRAFGFDLVQEYKDKFLAVVAKEFGEHII